MEIKHRDLINVVGGGSAMAADSESAFFAQRNSGDHIRVYSVRRRPLDRMAEKGLMPVDIEGSRVVLLEEFADWSPELLKLISDNDGH
jgi:hypothetical protein